MRAADEDAFRAFVHGRSAPLLRTAYLLTGNWADAEDLLQTALAKIYRSWGRLEDRENLDAYARKVMVHTRTSWWRRAWRAEKAFGFVPDTATPDPNRTTDERDRLRRALDTLPPRQRAVVVLRHYDDLPEHDVARLLGCSVGTVKSQCARGLAKLRVALEAAAAADAFDRVTPDVMGARS